MMDVGIWSKKNERFRHRGRQTVINQYLEKKTNEKMDWPASDLNPKSMYGTSSRDKYQLEVNPI